MMGRRGGDQNRLFYDFCLEDRVPADHLMRRIDRVLDLKDLHKHLAGYYSHTGRPSVDPELMVRMLIIGYCRGIRSERQLCEEVDLNLAYRWFCRLGLERPVPDHSTFSKNRHGRFRESDLLRHLFEQSVRGCMSAGLVGGEGFAVDASMIRANASGQQGVPGDQGLDSSVSSRAVNEYLAVLDNTAFGAATEVTPKFISPSDPAARWTGAHRGPGFFGYSINYLVDVKAAVIVDVETTAPIRTAEVDSARQMVERTESNLGLKPERLIGDTAYGSAKILGWMVDEKGIAPHVSLNDKGERHDGTFSRSDFVFDSGTNSYTCPGGKLLLQYHRNFKNKRTGITKDEERKYRATAKDCQGCALKDRCCPGQSARKLSRSVYEPARDEVRRLMETSEYQQSRRDRKKVEMLFAHLKRILKLDRLRLRGPCGARDEFLLAAYAQNLRKMARDIPQTPNIAPA